MTAEELAKLTPEEKCAKIADLIGGPKYHRPTESEIASGSYYQYCPDYLNDLNAMHVAEKVMTDAQRWTQVQFIVGYKHSPAGFPLLSLSETLKLAASSAAQRADAFLLSA